MPSLPPAARRLSHCLAIGLGLQVAAAAPAPAADLFVDRAAATGIDFVHFNGMSGELYYAEMAGGGGALFDFDNDGDLDVYLVQGTMMGPGKTIADAIFPPHHPLPLTDRLYRNDMGKDGDPTLRFTDVTEEAGLSASRYGMGVSAGDFDNDGWTDLYVVNFGPNQLLRNNGDGTFSDVTAAAGADDSRWTAAASFLDLDRDGYLDLFVVNYVDFSYAVHKVCPRDTGQRDYCGPLAYDPEPDRLFHNRGDGTFEDISALSGIDRHAGTGLGIGTGDFNGDGLPDIYVANDMMPNYLWINQGDGTFVDDAMLAGSSVNRDGLSEASMGVAIGDFDRDGDEDIFMSHLVGETNTLYVNDGRGLFRDDTIEVGLATPSWNFTSFGTGWLDYDNDGWLDLLVVSGEVKAIEEEYDAHDPYPLHQPNQLFHNRGDGTLEEVTAQAGSVFALSEVSRGAAFGDVDNDGDTDVLVVNNAGPARLLINQVGQDTAWIGLRLVGAAVERDMLGAWVGVYRADGVALWRRVHTDSSYASASDPRVLVGLGEPAQVDRVEVRWPSGSWEVFRDLLPNAYNRLQEGSGERLER